MTPLGKRTRKPEGKQAARRRTDTAEKKTGEADVLIICTPQIITYSQIGKEGELVKRVFPGREKANWE